MIKVITYQDIINHKSYDHDVVYLVDNKHIEENDINLLNWLKLNPNSYIYFNCDFIDFISSLNKKNSFKLIYNFNKNFIDIKQEIAFVDFYRNYFKNLIGSVVDPNILIYPNLIELLDFIVLNQNDESIKKQIKKINPNIKFYLLDNDNLSVINI